MRRLALLSAVALLVATVDVALAFGQYRQRQWFGGFDDVPIDPPPALDGRFTFARLKFPTGPGGYYFKGLPAWAHGYIGGGQGRRSETSLSKILNSITNMNPHVDGTRVVDIDDPDLFLFPIVYATEPGFMELNDKQAQTLGDYVRKGGFIIFDDFRGDADWENFRATMHRVLPDEQPSELSITHPIFHAFFDIATLDFVQYYDRGKPVFYGMFEKNDPSKRLQVIANFNNDVSEYWEFSDTGFTPIALSNEAYKLGVNYIIYGMTH
jgi:Domain of unknown function (DUF4159)